MTNYFATTNNNGLISQKLTAPTAADAIAEVKAAIADRSAVDWYNGNQTDLEDACGVECDGLDYNAALAKCVEHGAKFVWGEPSDDQWNIWSHRAHVTTSARLQDITGRESGFIVYDDGSVICCNWSSIDGLPRGSFAGLIGLGEELRLAADGYGIKSVLNTVAVDLDEVRDYSDGSGVAELHQNDCEGIMFNLGHAMVICPKGWA